MATYYKCPERTRRRVDSTDSVEVVFRRAEQYHMDWPQVRYRQVARKFPDEELRSEPWNCPLDKQSLAEPLQRRRRTCDALSGKDRPRRNGGTLTGHPAFLQSRDI